MAGQGRHTRTQNTRTKVPPSFSYQKWYWRQRDLPFWSPRSSIILRNVRWIVGMGNIGVAMEYFAWNRIKCQIFKLKCDASETSPWKLTVNYGINLLFWIWIDKSRVIRILWYYPDTWSWNPLPATPSIGRTWIRYRSEIKQILLRMTTIEIDTHSNLSGTVNVLQEKMQVSWDIQKS